MVISGHTYTCYAAQVLAPDAPSADPSSNHTPLPPARVGSRDGSMLETIETHASSSDGIARPLAPLGSSQSAMDRLEEHLPCAKV